MTGRLKMTSSRLHKLEPLADALEHSRTTLAEKEAAQVEKLANRKVVKMPGVAKPADWKPYVPPASTIDLAVGDRITMGDAPGVVFALPNCRGWWQVRLEGDEAVREVAAAVLRPSAAAAAGSSTADADSDGGGGGVEASAPLARGEFAAVVHALRCTASVPSLSQPRPAPLVAAGGIPAGRSVVDALTAAGIPLSAVQVTADQTAIGLPVDSLLLSVRSGQECVLAQFDGDGFTTVTAPVLSTGACLVGATASID